MEQYIPKSDLVAEIEKRIDEINQLGKKASYEVGLVDAYKIILSCLNTIEAKKVNLEKLEEIARHLIAVKEHIEDMRLDKEEWLMLEKIGYPEIFKAQKGGKV